MLRAGAAASVCVPSALRLAARGAGPRLAAAGRRARVQAAARRPASGVAPAAEQPSSGAGGSRWYRWALLAAALGLPLAKVVNALLPLWSEEDARSLPAKGMSTFENAPAAGSFRLEDVGVSAWFLMSEASDRLIRDAFTAGLMVATYLRESRQDTPDWSAAHSRAAQRLLVLCAANRGVYIKLGQHVAMLEHLLPAEYVKAMQPLCHTAPTSRFEDVRSVVEADLGRPLEEVFSSFDQRPIASASLAQVHKAVLRSTGQTVAVKVQHRGLREASAVDLRTISALVDAVRARFPRFEYRWLVNEIRVNLPRELDFRLEAANIERTGRLLAGRDDVVVPSVFHDASSGRVLTMSFEDGCYITNKERIEAMGLPAAQVALSMAQVFSDQTFKHGFLHCDPHAGNILVRPHPADARRAQLVLLDHGLYRELDEKFRGDYARLWTSIIFADEEGIRAAAETMGVGEDYALFACMLTAKPWDQVLNPSMESLRIDRSPEGRAVTSNYATENASQINSILGRVPRELLLLLKTLDCLRSIDAALGNPVDTFEVTARACLARICEERSATAPGWASAWQNALDWVGLESRFAVFHAAGWWLGDEANTGPAASGNGVTMVGQAGGAEGGTGVDDDAAAAERR